MTTLRIIVVPAWAMPALERAGGYAVILGDCIMPGHVLARAASVEEADEKGRWWSRHYGLPLHPIDWESALKRSDAEADAVLGRLIPGGGR